MPEYALALQLEDKQNFFPFPFFQTTMKLAPFSLVLLACASTACAQYFSEGWAPGKPATKEPSAPAATPVARPDEPAAAQQPEGTSKGSRSFFDVSRLLESAPVSNLFSKVGVNISQQLEAARAQIDTWDPRIPLITDSNYDELIVRESLTPEEKEKRVWFLVM